MNPRPRYVENISISIRNSIGLFQRFTIVRSNKGDIYFNYLGSEPENNTHSTYHQCGVYHHKSYGYKIFEKSKQRPNSNFVGTESIANTKITGKDARSINMQCKLSDFTGVMEIPQNLVNTSQGKQISIDLVEPNQKPWPSTNPYAKVIAQQIFKTHSPWI